MKNNSWVKTYIVAGHLGWLIISPLVLFVGGGAWLVNRFNLPSWLMIVFVLVGLGVMACGVFSYLRQLLNSYDDLKKKPPPLDKRDYDY